MYYNCNKVPVFVCREHLIYKTRSLREIKNWMPTLVKPLLQLVTLTRMDSKVLYFIVWFQKTFILSPGNFQGGSWIGGWALNPNILEVSMIQTWNFQSGGMYEWGVNSKNCLSEGCGLAQCNPSKHDKWRAKCCWLC